MYKQVFTLFRGKAYDAAETFADQNALPLLKQQIRDVSASVHSTRKAVAQLIAHHDQEKAHYLSLEARKTDLESRAKEALQQDKHELAMDAAQAIALLEDEIAASKATQERYQTEIRRMKAKVQQAQSDLQSLKRGERLVIANEQSLKLGKSPCSGAGNTIEEARETLARLQRRQDFAECTHAAEQEMKNHKTPADIVTRLAEEGCGKPLNTKAEDVLARLTGEAGKASAQKKKSN